jgi:ABC-type multidrug transport system ATPase subunit
VLRLFEIEHLRGKPVARLSSDEGTRVGLCKALMNDPELILDRTDGIPRCADSAAG